VLLPRQLDARGLDPPCQFLAGEIPGIRYPVAHAQPLEREGHLDAFAVQLGVRHGVAVAGDLSREELASRIESSRVELPREEHRKAHAADWREWGSRGGRATLARYGRSYFRHLALRRWGRITVAELARVRDRLRSAREAAA
jgi:hypothetical protein